MASQLREHILITVPVEVSEERLARLKTKFPNVEITVIPTPSPRSVEWKTYKQPGKGTLTSVLIPSIIAHILVP